MFSGVKWFEKIYISLVFGIINVKNRTEDDVYSTFVILPEHLKLFLIFVLNSYLTHVLILKNLKKI